MQVTIFMQCDVPADTQAQLTEPDKCEAWEWVPWSKVPAVDPLFLPLQILVDSPFKLT